MNVTKTLLDLGPNAKLMLQVERDGVWLHFQTKAKQSSINLPVLFGGTQSTGLDQTIVDWCTWCNRAFPELMVTPTAAPERQQVERDDDPDDDPADETETLKELISSARITELAERLVASGPKAAHVSCSECHEIVDWILEVQERCKKEAV